MVSRKMDDAIRSLAERRAAIEEERRLLDEIDARRAIAVRHDGRRQLVAAVEAAPIGAMRWDDAATIAAAIAEMGGALAAVRLATFTAAPLPVRERR